MGIRVSFTIIVLLLVSAGVLFFIKTQKTPFAPPVAVFFLPHQDDEMFLLGHVYRALAANYDVHVVMVTDGGHSAMRHTVEQLASARNREFYRAMYAIGVGPANIHFANPGRVVGSSQPRYQDGKLTKEQATQLIRYYHQQLGDGTYATIKANAGHADHVTLYQALRDFSEITDKYYFSEVIGQGEKVLLTPEEQEAKNTALESYYEWEPEKGKYAVGARSVKKLLDTWRTHEAEYIFAE